MSKQEHQNYEAARKATSLTGEPGALAGMKERESKRSSRSMGPLSGVADAAGTIAAPLSGIAGVFGEVVGRVFTNEHPGATAYKGKPLARQEKRPDQVGWLGTTSDQWAAQSVVPYGTTSEGRLMRPVMQYQEGVEVPQAPAEPVMRSDENEGAMIYRRFGGRARRAAGGEDSYR